MANYRYTQDLLEAMYASAGSMTTGAQLTTTALRYLNRAYQTVYSGAGELDPGVQENWLWARAAQPGYFLLYPEFSIVASFTNSSLAGTFTTGPGVSCTGAVVRVVNTAIPSVPAPYGLYHIAAHTGGQQGFTLTQLFAQATGDYLIRVMFAEYALATDCLRVIPPLRLFKPEVDVGDPPGGVYECNQVDIAMLNAVYPLARLEPVAPKYFAMIRDQRIRMSASNSAYPGRFTQVEYDYIQRPAELVNSRNEEPIVPREYRKILSDLALAYLYADKGDLRTQGFFDLAKRGHLAMAFENRTKIHFFDPSHAPMMPPPQSPPQG